MGEVTIRHVGILGYPMYDSLLDAGFCEVPHMARAYARTAINEGASAVTLCPITGWDGVWPFLDAGLVVYVYQSTLIPAEKVRPIFRSWQQMARRKYGPGRLKIIPKSAGRCYARVME